MAENIRIGALISGGGTNVLSHCKLLPDRTDKVITPVSHHRICTEPLRVKTNGVFEKQSH